MKAFIKNLTGSQEVAIETQEHGKDHTVMLWQIAGSVNFQFNMLPADARLMAAALIAGADEIKEASK